MGKATPSAFLLVDDEPLIRDLMYHFLRSYGASNVYVAENGKKAYETWQEHGSDIGFLITDITMPEMDGIALASQIKQQNQWLPIILMSGYHENLLEFNKLKNQYNDINFLEKPFTFQDLTTILDLYFSEKKR